MPRRRRLGLQAEVRRRGVTVGGCRLQRGVELVDGHDVGAESAQVMHDRAHERAHPAELADHHAQVSQRGAEAAETFEFAQRRHAGAAARMGAVDVEGTGGRGAEHAVGLQPTVALKVFERPGREGAEDAVDASAVETESAELALQRGDIVATHVGGDQLQRTVTEAPGSLDERQPRGFVADVLLSQAVRALERPYGGVGRRAVGGGLGAGYREAGAAEPTLQVADRFAVLSRRQWAETRNSSSSCSSWVLPMAPTSFLLISPPVNTSIVGMLITL